MSNKRTERFPEKSQKNIDTQLRGIASKIQRARKAAGLSQERLAEGLNVSPGSIKTIEQGRRIPSLSFLIYICESLNIKITIG